MHIFSYIRRANPLTDATFASCAYFFAVCGIAYGSVMARIPAIKAEVGLNEAELGTALLGLGIGALIAFALAGWAQTRIPSRKVLIVGGLLQLLCFPLVGFADQWAELVAAFIIMGFFSGVTEAGVGTQAVLVERAAGKPRMSTLHAMYSLGGLCGSLSGALLAAFLTPLPHFWLMAGAMLCLLPFASRHLLPDHALAHTADQSTEQSQNETPIVVKTGFRLPPLAVFLIGALTLCSYASEGTVGDWGSLLLHEVKGASESVAALAYAAFSTTMVIMRLCGDRMRSAYGDFHLMRFLALIATGGIVVALMVPWPAVSLAGYALMGIGLSVIVPILFSAVGRVSGISTGAAVAVVSAMGFGGQLIAPPLIGMLAHIIGLREAMSVVIIFCICLVLGSSLLKKLR